MATNILENMIDSHRAITVEGVGAVVYISLPCGIDDHPEHVVGVDRATFYAALADEFGLVHTLEAEAQRVDWDTELAKLDVAIEH